MDMNSEKINALVKQVEKIQLQIDAICKKYGIGLDYKPHEYTPYDVPEDEGSEVDGQ